MHTLPLVIRAVKLGIVGYLSQETSRHSESFTGVYQAEYRVFWSISKAMD